MNFMDTLKKVFFSFPEKIILYAFGDREAYPVSPGFYKSGVKGPAEPKDGGPLYRALQEKL